MNSGKASVEASSTGRIGRVILLMGAPGCGKGTQASMLESQFGMKSISTGSMLREASKQDTAAGHRLRKIMSSGKLVDDGTVCDAVAPQIRESLVQADLILDGFPRTIQQARWLDGLLEGLASPGPLVIHLDVPNEVLLHRLVSRRQCAQCGAVYNLASGPLAGLGRCEYDGGVLVERDDDNEGIAERRLVAYEAETMPVIDYYRRNDYCRGSYRRIDGNRSAAEIAKDVCETVLFAETAVAA